MAWIYLALAGVCEVVMIYGVRLLEGFTRPSVLGALCAFLGGTLSLVLVTLAAKTLPISIAYVAWTGMGAAGAVFLGVVLFGDHLTPFRAACVCLIVAGIAGLQWAQGSTG